MGGSAWMINSAGSRIIESTGGVFFCDSCPCGGITTGQCPGGGPAIDFTVTWNGGSPPCDIVGGTWNWGGRSWTNNETKTICPVFYQCLYQETTTAFPSVLYTREVWSMVLGAGTGNFIFIQAIGYYTTCPGFYMGISPLGTTSAAVSTISGMSAAGISGVVPLTNAYFGKITTSNGITIQWQKNLPAEWALCFP